MGRLPTPPQEPGPLQSRGYPGSPGAVPHPGGRRLLLRRVPSCLALRGRSPARPGRPSAPHRPPSTRPRAPRPPPARPRRPSGPRPRLLSGSPWPGTVSTAPQTASKNFERRPRKRTRRARYPRPWPKAAAAA